MEAKLGGDAMRPSFLLVRLLFPQEERDIVGFMNWQVTSLTDLIHEFESAIELRLFSESKLKETIASPGADRFMTLRLYSDWQRTAMYEGARIVYLFEKTIKKGIKHPLLDQKQICPKLRSVVSLEQLESAHARFIQYFPGHEGLRHVGQHAGELNNNPKKYDSNSVSGINVSMTSFVDGTFSAPYRNQMFSYALTHDSVKKLEEIRNMIHEAFAEATKFSSEADFSKES